ncbi:unnamed protein product [Effrenium voratum]|nr:unnamed protein product [Effrenium voratum]
MAIFVEAECALTQEGDEVCLAGATANLGAWDVSKALRLSTGPEIWPRWAAEVEVPKGTECKLILRRRAGQVEWEGINGNRTWPEASAKAKLSMKFGVPDMNLRQNSGYAPAATSSKASTALTPPAQAPVNPAPPAAVTPADPNAAASVRLPSAAMKGLKVPEEEGHTLTSPGSSKTPKSRDLRGRFIIEMEDGYETNIEERFTMDKTQIGDGAFSVVTRATNKATGAVRAVKSVLKSRVPSMEALHAEIEMAKNMDHPKNIVRLYAVYEDQRHVYLVMELCEGGELFDRVGDAFTGGEEVVRKCMRQIFASVAYCHAHSIAHRDLKPENYLLHDKDKPLAETTLKLIDFGLAKRLPESGHLKTRVGTPYYVAPEVLAQNYGEPADVWSCGVMMYILCCGRPPFNADKDDSDILKLIKIGKYSMSDACWSSVSDNAKHLIKSCLEMVPRKRITAQDALHHEWFHAEAVASGALDADVMRNFRSFSMANRFRKAALTAVAYQLTEEEQKDLREAWAGYERGRAFEPRRDQGRVEAAHGIDPEGFGANPSRCGFQRRRLDRVHGVLGGRHGPAPAEERVRLLARLQNLRPEWKWEDHLCRARASPRRQ